MVVQTPKTETLKEMSTTDPTIVNQIKEIYVRGQGWITVKNVQLKNNPLSTSEYALWYTSDGQEYFTPVNYISSFRFDK